MLKELTINYKQSEADPISLTVSRATAVMGMERSILRFRGYDEAKEQPEALQVLRITTYPDLIACTVSVSGIPWPLSFGDFCALDDGLVSQWEQAVYRVNPHWNPAGAADEDAEKKE